MMRRLPIFIFVPFFMLVTSCHYNIGHRLGGDVVKQYPENTVQGLSLFLSRYKNSSNFRYIEFDIQESADSSLFVFHDKYINRMVPVDKFGNDGVLKSKLRSGVQKIPLSELNSDVIQKLNLTNDSVKIPELDDIFPVLKDAEYRGKVYVEVKYITTDEGREKFIRSILKYRDDIEIYVLAFKTNFKKSFPDTKKWCSEFNEKRIPVVRVGTHSKICRT